jgi:hypothetical protein
MSGPDAQNPRILIAAVPDFNAGSGHLARARDLPRDMRNVFRPVAGFLS